MSKIGARVEMLFCFIAMSAFLGAYSTIPLRLQGIEILGGESNPFNAAAMAVVLVGTFVLIVVNWRGFFMVARLGGPVNLFAALAVASTLWSYDPGVSLRRSLALIQIMLFAFYLVARFPIERVLRLLTAVIALASVFSVVLALAMPDIGIMHEGELAGAWRGVFEHKSGLGAACVLGTLCFAWQWIRDPRRRPLHSAGLLLCLVLAIMSQSKTAQLMIVLLLPIAACLHFLRAPGLRRLWAAYVTLALLLAGAAVLILFFPGITAAAGKDETLTGRTPVWMSLLEFALQHPLGGYGYTAFFVPENPDVQDVWRRGGWIMWDAHNMVIGILLELGIPGLMLSAWVLLRLIWRSLQAFSADAGSWAGFAFAYAISFACMGSVEMIIFRPDINSVLITMFHLALRQQASRPQPKRAGDAALWAGTARDPVPYLRR